ncbi:MAG: HAD-IIA family hydrolase [Acidimicrobiales bacterium]
MTWLLDLDGVVWLGTEPISGAAEAVAVLRARGDRVVFITNNSNAPAAAVEAKLASFGIPAGGDVVTSAEAGALLLEPGERVLVCGGPGVWQAVAARRAIPVDALDERQVDAVLVGYHREFDYERMRVAARAVRRGARLLATNDDVTFPTLDGPIPGNGSILAGIVLAAGSPPVAVAGKGHPTMAALVRDRYGADGWMVGDRPDTDGRFARTIGYRFALVLSGVTTAGDLPVDPEPDLIAADLAEVVARAAG